jgi:hypothetical protein
MEVAGDERSSHCRRVLDSATSTVASGLQRAFLARLAISARHGDQRWERSRCLNPAAYRERRLNDNFDLTGVGYRRRGLALNQKKKCRREGKVGLASRGR